MCDYNEVDVEWASNGEGGGLSGVHAKAGMCHNFTKMTFLLEEYYMYASLTRLITVRKRLT